MPHKKLGKKTNATKKTTVPVLPIPIDTRPPPPYASILVGQWGVIINGTAPIYTTDMPQSLPTDARLLTAIWRISFDPLPGRGGNGQFKYYVASNHGGNVIGRLVTGAGNFATEFNTGAYMINPDGATGWMRFPPTARIATYSRFSFVITNDASELFLILTELPQSDMTDPVITDASVGNYTRSILWGMAKRETVRGSG